MSTQAIGAAGEVDASGEAAARGARPRSCRS